MNTPISGFNLLIWHWTERWLGFFGHDDKWTDCCTFPLWKEQIRCEDRDETIPLRSRPG